MRQKKEASFNFLKEDSTETTIRRIWSNPKKAKKEPKEKPKQIKSFLREKIMVKEK